MKSMKEYLICISLYAALFIAGGCSNENDITTGNGNGNPVPLTIHAAASGFESLPGTETPDVTFDTAVATAVVGSDAPVTRTPTEDGNTTKFSAGDAIGVFAIKDGAILDGINNTQLVYTLDATGTSGTWTPPADGNGLYYYKDEASLTYIAYYPYKSGITITPTQTTDEIIASLAANSNLQPASNQSATNGSAYTASDLMTASGTSANITTNASGEAFLDLKFTHQFCLLVLVPRVFVKCTAPASAGFVYRTGAKSPVTDSHATTVTLNGVTAFKMSDGSYRAIVKPTTDASTLNGSYMTKDDRTVDYEGNAYTTGFATGKRYSLAVDSPLPGDGSTVRALAPGDFVFHGTSDIEVYPGDGPLTEDGNTKIPGYSNAIGVVVTCDKSRMTDTQLNDKGWNHACVMGLVNAANNINWGPVVDESVLPNMTRDNGAANDMNGYTETEAMLAERTTKGDLSRYGAFNAINTYRTNNPIPAGLSSVRSPWFIPSIGQWFDVMANICGQSPETFGNNNSSYWFNYSTPIEMWDTINSQLSKVNKPLTNFGVAGGWQVIFYSSTEKGDNWVLCAEWTTAAGKRCSLWSFAKSTVVGQRVVRPFFAF